MVGMMSGCEDEIWSSLSFFTGGNEEGVGLGNLLLLCQQILNSSWGLGLCGIRVLLYILTQ